MNISRVDQLKRWDRALLKLKIVDREPEEEVLAFLNEGPAHLGMKGLEIGCGLGRHTLAALTLGFKMVAVDFSEVAVKGTRELVKAAGFKANILFASMGRLPFRDGEFDFTFSWCVLNHGTRSLFERALVESIRVLRYGGISFGFVISRNDPRYGCGVAVDEDCFRFIDGPEAGIIHYFPTKEVLEGALNRVACIKGIKEVRYQGEEIKTYHPELSFSCHFAYRVQKLPNGSRKGKGSG